MKINTQWNGMEVIAEVLKGVEGDSSLEHGTNDFIEIEYIDVISPSGADISEYLNGDAMDEIEYLVLEDAR